ncbi:helix-turn-helix transcriptional regulator [Nocardia bhagyanarayanae]|uniref:helix-turn-helix transcriptional regulator n=1 Tax=Nocardia bhagyanarayanae TaxID=1215925 RepID=UPI00163AA043|nr:helix-turn-helix transcriptional regulator [Nocardia bhagyanarayanae]
MSGVVSGVLVGRAAEVAELADAFRDEQVAAVLIGGEAGIGKSRLVAEFSGRLDPSVLTPVGRCLEFGSTAVPFAPFVAALSSLVRRLGVDEVAALLPPQPALARWLPQLAVRSGLPAVESDRTQLFGEVLMLLEQLGARRPVVLVLEDLHWADQGTRELLAFLVANLAQRRILLIGTYRPAESGPLRDLVAQLRRDPAVRMVAPQPLTRHEVGRQLAALLNSEPAPEAITRVFERSGGNPLFVEALSRSTEYLPADLTDLLLSFLSGLGDASRVVVAAAAVIGSPVRHDMLAALSGLPAASLLAALRELTDRELLHATDTGYEFRHVLIRQTVYEDLLPAERSRMHAALVEILRTHRAALPPPVYYAELAHHAEASGDLRRALIAFWKTAAALDDAAAQLYPLQRVVDLWDRLPAAELLDTTRSAVLEQFAAACDRSGEVVRGITAVDDALAAVDPALDPSRAARLYRLRAALRSRTGAGPGADVDRALELLAAQPPTVLRAEVLADRAVHRVFAGDPAGAAEDATAVLRTLESHAELDFGPGDRPIPDSVRIARSTARAHAYRGLASADDIDTAIACFEQARRAAELSSDTRTAVDVAVWESAVLVGAGRYEAAIGVVQRGLRAAQAAFRFEESGPILFVKWTQALTALGRWPEALGVVDDVQLSQLPPLSVAALRLSHARIALAQGDSQRALTLAEQVAALLGDGVWARQYRIQLHVLHTALAVQREDMAAARAVLDRSVADGTDVLTAYPHETWPLVALSARVPQAPGELRALADSMPRTSPVHLAHSAVFRAHTTGSAPDWSTAADAWAALRQPYEHAQALLAAADSAVTAGDRASATAALRLAVSRAADLGAVHILDAARQLARRSRLTVDDSPVGAASTNADSAPRGFGLTARELDVLRLIAEGMSNRSIATELFISPNTAGVHVSRILTKLGASSRTEAAAIAHRHNLIS